MIMSIGSNHGVQMKLWDPGRLLVLQPVTREPVLNP